MITWYLIVQVVVAVAAGVFCAGMGIAGRKPNDYVLGAVALVEVLLIGQLVIALLSPAFGNAPTGSGAEFWAYLISALILPIAAAFWALIDRTRWSSVILGVACFAIAVMVFRMGQIWFVQVA